MKERKKERQAGRQAGRQEEIATSKTRQTGSVLNASFKSSSWRAIREAIIAAKNSEYWMSSSLGAQDSVICVSARPGTGPFRYSGCQSHWHQETVSRKNNCIVELSEGLSEFHTSLWIAEGIKHVLLLFFRKVEVLLWQGGRDPSMIHKTETRTVQVTTPQRI